MERRVELLTALGATILGLIGVVMEGQALANPVASPTFSWMLGMGQADAGTVKAMANVQHALFPMAAMLSLVGAGAYLHSIHGQVIGLGLLMTSSVIVVVAATFAVFNATYLAILLVPAPLIVLTAVLTASACVCAVSSAGVGFSIVRSRVLRMAGFRPVRPRSTS